MYTGQIRSYANQVTHSVQFYNIIVYEFTILTSVINIVSFHNIRFDLLR